MHILFGIVMLLVWLVLIVLNFWLFQKTKNQGNLLMVLGAAVLALVHFIALVAVGASQFLVFWLPMAANGSTRALKPRRSSS